MHKDLKWETLESRGMVSEFTCVEKMVAGQVDLYSYDCFKTNTNKSLRHEHSKNTALQFALLTLIDVLYFVV